MKTTNLTLQEALQLLDIYEKANEVAEKLKNSKSSQDSAYSDDYTDLEEANRLAAVERHFYQNEASNKAAKKIKQQPEVGDIAFLKIKLTDHSKLANKNVYDGYERRPILIININKANLIDGLEITHSNTFLGQKLIPIKSLSTDKKVSYLNIYNSEKYQNLPTSYEFPIAFDKNHKPISVAEYLAKSRSFAKIETKKDSSSSELYNITFTYQDNFETELSSEQLAEILDIIKDKL